MDMKRAVSVVELHTNEDLEGFKYEGLVNLSEDQVKTLIQLVLEQRGWQTGVRFGHEQGIDIVAIRGTERLVIEAKGEGSRNAMRVNYFLGALGELLQRMDTPDAHYGLAFPAHRQFVNLVVQLPIWVRQRLNLCFFFVRSHPDRDEVGIVPSTSDTSLEWRP